MLRRVRCRRTRRQRKKRTNRHVMCRMNCRGHRWALGLVTTKPHNSRAARIRAAMVEPWTSEQSHPRTLRSA